MFQYVSGIGLPYTIDHFYKSTKEKINLYKRTPRLAAGSKTTRNNGIVPKAYQANRSHMIAYISTYISYIYIYRSIQAYKPMRSDYQIVTKSRGANTIGGTQEIPFFGDNSQYPYEGSHTSMQSEVIELSRLK